MLAASERDLLPMNPDRGAARAGADVPGAPSLALVADTWAFRVRAERESALRFARLARELTDGHAQPVVIELARRGAHEEHRHSQLCAAVCRLYGGKVPDRSAHDHPASWPGLNGRDRVLFEVVSFACIAETINVHLLTEILRRAKEPRILRVVRRLLRDEVEHARFGWAHLAWERAQGRGDFLAELLPRMLAGSVDEGLFVAGPEPVDEWAIAHGELPSRDRIDLFAVALREVVLPGFETFGINTAAGTGWLNGRLAAVTRPLEP